MVDWTIVVAMEKLKSNLILVMFLSKVNRIS